MKIAISAWGYCLTERPMPDSWVLPQLLEREGLALTSIRDPEAEVFIALDYSRNSLGIASKNVPRSRRLLVAFEPKAVNPAQHSRRVREKFAKSVVMSPLQILGESDQVLTLGALVPNEVSVHLALGAGSQRENAIVILNENKFSFVPGNNYKLRQLAIQELAKAGWQVHVGGANWTRGISWQIRKQLESLLFAIFSRSFVSLENLRFAPRNWSRNITFHGRIPDGFAFMRRYKFALVIENDMSYVSEKLPNAILSGCVPVFVGPDLALHGIPGGVAISAKSDANHIVKTFDSLGESTGFDVLSAGREWLCGPETIDNFSHDVGLQRIVGTIKTFTQECMGR